MKTVDFSKCIQRIIVSLSFCATGVHAISGQPGTLDPTWAGFALGKVITPFGTSRSGVNALALQPDGKVVAVGACEITPSSPSKFCLARYNADGSPDLATGDNGRLWKVMTVGSSNDIARAVAIQANGRIVLGGFCDVGGVNQFCMLRYRSGGFVDADFGVSGKVFTAVGGGDSFAFAMAQQPDGKLLLAGRCQSGGTAVFCAARYDTDGTLDTTFATNGIALTPVGDTGYALAIALQPDGRIVLAGRCDSGGQTNICAVRYLSSGTLDAGFASLGRVITDLSGSQDVAYALAIQSDGKIVLSGGCIVNPPQPSFCLLRYNSNGSLDTSFDGNGMLATSFSNGSSKANAMLVQPDGKLLVAGDCGSIFCAARYNDGGSLDNTFAGNGKVATAVSGNDTTVHTDEPRAVALQPDGKILVAGGCTNGSYTDFCIIRYDGGPFGAKNCKLDIDGDGKVVAAIDILIATRVALGLRGSTLLSGITLGVGATRNTWSEIRDYLVSQCGMSVY
jgi:uncharacterized delta-60 repeat protein